MRILSCLFLALVLLSGCKKEQKLPSGYKYVVHTHSTGKALKAGDFAYYRFQLRNGDSVVASNFQLIQVPDSATMKQQPQNPIFEALLRMKNKDSITIFVPLDTLKEEQKPEGFKGAKIMYYDMVIKDVLSTADMQKIFTDFQKTMQDKTKKRTPEQMKSELARAKAFVDKTAKEYLAGSLKGIKTTASGLKYLVHEPGTGPVFKNNDFIFVDYYGALTDGTMFDNSFEREADFSFPVGKQPLIPGWMEGLQMVKKGMKVSFFIPSGLGYGPQGSPPKIPGNAELIFYIEGNDTFTPNPYVLAGQPGM